MSLFTPQIPHFIHCTQPWLIELSCERNQNPTKKKERKKKLKEKATVQYYFIQIHLAFSKIILRSLVSIFVIPPQQFLRIDAWVDWYMKGWKSWVFWLQRIGSSWSRGGLFILLFLWREEFWDYNNGGEVRDPMKEDLGFVLDAASLWRKGRRKTTAIFLGFIKH